MPVFSSADLAQATSTIRLQMASGLDQAVQEMCLVSQQVLALWEQLMKDNYGLQLEVATSEHPC